MGGDSSWQEALAAKIIVGMPARTVSIGRDRGCMVHIGRKTTIVSRNHAEITDTGANRYRLQVLGLNGVRVNGVLHTKDTCIDLETGDEINFVGIKYKFRAPPVPLAKHLCQHHIDVDDWWPEPVVRKRVQDTDHALAAAPAKRVRLLSGEESELYRNSTDTLVGSSEACGVLGSDITSATERKTALLTKQLIDDLPPSSPVYMGSITDMVFAAPEDEHCEDALPDSIDILAVAPTPTPTPTLSHVIKTDIETATSAQAKTLPAAVAAPKQAQNHKKTKPAVAKENMDPVQNSKQGGKSAKARKQHRSSNEQHEKCAAKAGGHVASKRDEEMQASLRELLGIVDPSECLADSIDDETEEFLTTRPAQPINLPSGANLADLVIETMVFSARTSHTISDLVRDIARAEGEEDMRGWRHHLTWTLFHNKCFGRVERRVKDASDKRAEDKWYYEAAKDDCIERRENFGGLVRTARRCTLRDTQYFFKQVPKLPSFRYR
ncbi:hypothetical protein BX070DRAFT_249525 [Coemansia spiralis]|nr:hypothetical protein BX070DRAFT_249525 [Coemansia spiralis]